MKHFLEKMQNPDWVWAEQYEDTEEVDEAMLMMDNGTEGMLAASSNRLNYMLTSNLYLLPTQ
jgi:hypothetical protein